MTISHESATVAANAGKKKVMNGRAKPQAQTNQAATVVWIR